MTTVKVEPSQSGWGLWLRWMRVSVLGLGLGLVVGGPIFAVGVLYAYLVGYQEGAIFGAVIGGVGGTILGMVAGIMQRRLLRRYVVGAWVRASIMGYALSFAVLASLVGLSSSGWTLCFPSFVTGQIDNCPAISPVIIDLSLIPGLALWSLGGIVIGMVVGTMQWLVLRRRVSRAGWWVLANIVGWAASATAVGFTLTSWFGFASGPWYVVIVVAVAGGSLYVAVSGIALVWLLRDARERPALEATPTAAQAA